jgi:UDP-glucose:(heptosyl)LPS alpha-1,3-glucosyltransferase
LLAADLLVHPARAEAGGIVLLEALVAGLPVITTDVCGYAHHVREAGAGTVLDSPFRQHTLEQALQRGFDETWREDCRERALQYATVTDLYSMHATAAGIIERVIEQKLERNRDSAR